MTLRRPLFVLPDGSSNGTSPADARLALGALFATDGSSALAVRQGVLYDGIATAAVVGTTDTGTMTYQIRAARYVLYPTGAASGGASTCANDAAVKVNTTAAPGSNSRIDVIWVRQQMVASDGGSDTANLPLFGVTQGTAAASPTVPSIPTGAIALAQAVVTTGTTQTSTTTITQVHNWATTAGSPIPVRNAAERNALTAYDSLQVYRLDNHVRETYNGTLWVADDISTVGSVTIVPAAGSAPTSGTVTFPSGLFQVAPNVITNAPSTVPGTVLGSGSSSTSTAGSTIWVARSNTTSTAVNYQAQQAQQA